VCAVAVCAQRDAVHSRWVAAARGCGGVLRLAGDACASEEDALAAAAALHTDGAAGVVRVEADAAALAHVTPWVASMLLAAEAHRPGLALAPPVEQAVFAAVARGAEALRRGAAGGCDSGGARGPRDSAWVALWVGKEGERG